MKIYLNEITNSMFEKWSREKYLNETINSIFESLTTHGKFIGMKVLIVFWRDSAMKVTRMKLLILFLRDKATKSL